MKRTLNLLIFTLLFGSFPGCDRPDHSQNNTGLIRVKVGKASVTQVLTKNYVGIVEASVSVPLSFSVTGAVMKVLVNEGEQVNKGDLLASLNPGSYLHAMEMAVAKEKQAEDAYRRLSELYHKGSLPEIKFIEVETGLIQATAASELTRKNLADCDLYAPVSGLIGRRSIEPGENVVPYQTVFTLVNTAHLDVKVSIPEKEIAGIRIGDQATITVPALGNVVFDGKVIRKGVMAQPLAHTYDVIIRIISNDKRLLPGMVCRTELYPEKGKSFALIPIKVVQTDSKGNRYILKPDASGRKVCRKTITLGELQGLHVEVTDGLIPGEEYISEGYQHLDTTMNIQILNQDEKK